MKVGDRQIERRDGSWYIDGEWWESRFARAIFPVETLVIAAEDKIKRHQGRETTTGAAIIAGAERMLEEAVADSECEVRWKARDKVISLRR
jgi:hypothetical protein